MYKARNVIIRGINALLFFFLIYKNHICKNLVVADKEIRDKNQTLIYPRK